MGAVRVLRRVAAVVLLIAVGLLGGYWIGVSGQDGAAREVHAPAENTASQKQKWYCSMHPQIVQDRPGLCPICHMELIPMPEGTATEASPRELTVSETAAKLMDVQTSPVERRWAMRRSPA